MACQPPPVTAGLGAADKKPAEERQTETKGEEPSIEAEAKKRSVEYLQVKIVAVYAHDPTAFTQGLLWDGGVLYESTGLYGRSTVRRVDPADGTVLEKTFLDPNFFGEGLALVGDRLIQLTWKAGIALVYELGGLQPVDQYGYNGEGWGLAYDGGERLVISNGSSLLTFRDPGDFRWRSTLEVFHEGRPVSHLNELEFAEGDLYSNIWGENLIARIDPDSGQVTAMVDASGLLTAQEARMVDVLNGIAYDPMSKTFWITGKFWPKIFQVVFVPREEG
ncbi:MAG: glutaminyl-peptide cyclotransferase [Thermoanaerobaculia bacterium]